MGPLVAAGVALGSSIAAEGASTAMGMMKNEKQYHLQKRMMEFTEQRNKQMAIFNREQQMKLWNDTNYAAQVEQLKKAGLNPALLYGMSGGGGATTNAAQAQGLSAPTVPGGATGREGMSIANIPGMAQQLRQTEAQTDLTQAQADLAKAQADKLRGVDTKLGEAQIQNISQGIQESQAKTRLTTLQGDYQTLANEIQKDTKQDQIQQIVSLAGKTAVEVNLLLNQEQITFAEAQLAKEKAEENLMKLKLENDNLRKNLNLTDAKINEITQSIAQKWKEINGQFIKDEKGNEYSINYKKYELEKWLRDMPDSYKLAAEVLTDIGGIILKKGPKPNIPKGKETHKYKEEGYEHTIETYK